MNLKDENKIHETEQDKINQKTVLDKFCSSKGMSAKETKKLRKTDAVLYASEGESPVGVAEIKCRKCAVDKYPTYTVDAKKIESLLYRGQVENLPSYLIVSWQGDVRYMQITHTDFPVTFQKRRDRAEKADRMYNIPIDGFTRI